MPKNIHLDPDYQKKYRSQEEHVARQQRYKVTNLEKKKKYLHEHLGDKCVWCGSQENLELDHINPSVGKKGNKTFGSRGVTTPFYHLKEQCELNNLRWLCHDCHKEHSVLQRHAAWQHFTHLPLEEQEKIMLQWKE